MKKFIIKSIVFFFLLFTLNGLIRNFIPYWWGNPGYIEKYEYLRDNKDDYNMIFLGSSRIYRHVIPAILDKKLKKFNVKSFNMAYAATNNPELFYLTENILEEDWFKFKYCIVELSPYGILDEQNFHSKRVKYHMNFESSMRSLRSFRFEDKLKFNQVYRYLVSYLEYKLNIGLIDDMYNFYMEDRVVEYDKLKRNRGYKKFNEKPGSVDYKRRYKPFIKKKTKALKSRAKKVHKTYSQFKNDSTIYNPAYYKKIQELIEIANKKGIHIIFILPLRAQMGKTTLTITNNLDFKNKIVIYDSKEYPQFYNVKNSFDIGHLNRRGAEKFTKVLSKKLKLILNTKQ